MDVFHLVANANRWLSIVVVVTTGLIVSANAQQETSAKLEDFGAIGQAKKQSCRILVQDNGLMVQNIGSTKLSSKINAGLAGRAEVEATNSSFDVVLDRPTGFVSTPAGGNADVVFKPSFSGRGKTNFLETPGDNRVRMKNGVTQLDINLEVVKLTGAFPAGYYEAELTLRCE